MEQDQGNNISIHHECEGGIEKSAPRITDWHHEACRVMTNGDHKGRIFLPHPHTNSGFFFSPTTRYLILYWKYVEKRLQEHPEYAVMRQGDVILTLQWSHGSTCSCSFFYLSLGLVWGCEKEIYHMGKNNGNSDLVCANTKRTYLSLSLSSVPSSFIPSNALLMSSR